MVKFLISICLLSINFLMAQNNKTTDRIYQDFLFNNDSLVLSGGVNPKEFSLINIKKELYYDYYRHVFTKSSDGEYTYTGHWSVPIKIYMDKRIDKSIKEDFVRFALFLPKIERLSISFVTNKEDANYYIYPVNEALDEFELDFYKGITYRLISDSSNKYYGGRLFFNPEQLKDNNVIKTRLRQFFFSTLGGFCIRGELGEDSLLSENYVMSRTISEYDYTILRFHYGLYNENPLGYPELKKLLKKINTTTFTNVKGRLTLTLEE